MTPFRMKPRSAFRPAGGATENANWVQIPGTLPRLLDSGMLSRISSHARPLSQKIPKKVCTLRSRNVVSKIVQFRRCQVAVYSSVSCFLGFSHHIERPSVIGSMWLLVPSQLIFLDKIKISFEAFKVRVPTAYPPARCRFARRDAAAILHGPPRQRSCKMNYVGSLTPTSCLARSTILISIFTSLRRACSKATPAHIRYRPRNPVAGMRAPRMSAPTKAARSVAPPTVGHSEG